ncbi:hypothetical protein EIH08_07880 [Chryseobacterium taklimakanense]|uniref:Bacterial toxin 23 domain-containing protein n=2 Tax=Chryseobacterium taklimakanense TaxID=536441 RepID=A0A3G8WHH6_9FLAO|nr:hypothetical protein EIH08_07880 [Chryseobacterium taklimakanense]
MYNDPSGEIIPFIAAAVAWIVSNAAAIATAAAIGAAVGLAAYTVGVLVTGSKWSLVAALKATFWGGISGAVTFGIGSIFSSAAQTFGNAILQAAAHGIAQGTLSLMQGASFKQAFIAGALGSLGASAWGYALNKVGLSQFASSTVGTVAFGALSGGIGAELSGGNFWQGALIGGIVAGLNHAMHSIGDNDDEWMLTKDGKTVKVGTKGGDKTDYLYDEFNYAQTAESRTLLATADVQHSTVTSGSFSPGGYPIKEGFGFRIHTKFGGHGLYDPSFDVVSTLAGGGGSIKLTHAGSNYLAKWAFNSKSLGYQSKLFGRYHHKFLPNGVKGSLNQGYIRTGWRNHGSSHVFRTAVGHKLNQCLK